MLSAPQNISAKRAYRGYHDGDLSFEGFLKLSQINCWYCGAEPSNTTNWYLSCLKSKPNTSQYLIDNGNFIYNGLDRLNNNKPHNTNNVVPCCFNCNRAKNDMNLLQFRNHISKMLLFRLPKYGGDYNKITIPIFASIQLVSNVISVPEKAIPGAVFGKLLVLIEAEKLPMGQGKHKRMMKAFLCRCECGIEKVVLARSLEIGHTKSCNAGLCRGKNTPQVSSAKKLWSSGGYKKEGLPFEAFFQCSQMNCFYCGGEPSNSYASDRSDLIEYRFIYNGLDRLDSTKGHSINNIIPCCWICNRAKNRRSVIDFNGWLTDIKNVGRICNPYSTESV